MCIMIGFQMHAGPATEAAAGVQVLSGESKDARRAARRARPGLSRPTMPAETGRRRRAAAGPGRAKWHACGGSLAAETTQRRRPGGPARGVGHGGGLTVSDSDSDRD